MRILKFSYKSYNFILFFKFFEVVIKKFIKYILFSGDTQKKRFFKERLGILSKGLIAMGKEKWIWIHANTIGEVNTSSGLIELIKSKYPKIRVLLTTTNFSADERAHQISSLDAVLFFPYDVPFIIRKLLRIFRPGCIVIIECDIWPNFIKICKDKGVPVLVLSGMYADNDTRSLDLRHLYNLVFRLSEEVLGKIDYYCMQTDKDTKMLSMMLPGHKNIITTGNLKFSILNSKIMARKNYYQTIFNIKKGDPVFMMGNIHSEEVKIILDAFAIVQVNLQTVRMILAPRFIKDVDYIEAVLKERKLGYVRRTFLDEQNRAGERITILDTMGELAEIYSLATVAFVGGSIVFLGNRFGGHNILEPAASGVPVLFGPYMHNFQALADLFLERHAAVQVNNAQELADAALRCINDPQEAQKLVYNSGEIFRENRNVAERTFFHVDAILKRIRYN